VTPDFDWKNPDYPPIFRRRISRLAKIRANPDMLPLLKTHYKHNPIAFINDWGCTTDPRNVADGLPVVLPFILFPRQIEWLEWVLDSWRNSRPGVTAKSREVGISWLAVGLSCTLCLFNDHMSVGFGSAKSEYVDKIGDPKSIFWKAREFMALLPREFRGTWTRDDAPKMLLKFPDTGSVIGGEGGDNIGRGNRTSLYFVDEAAWLEHPDDADAALLSTTRCRIDMSSVRGTGNPFHRKVTTWPSERVFIFHWREDPRKGDAWYEKQCSEHDPVKIAQELDIDFSASVEGRLIPSAWVQAAVDAHLELGIKPTGRRAGALDVADEGSDLNAFCGAHGVVIEFLDEWSGKGDDIFATVQRAFGLCDIEGYREFRYDADGLGAGVRGDARIINDQRKASGRTINVIPFRGSEGVHDPDGQDVKGQLNKDMFANSKAQSWWGVMTRFQKTHRWRVDKEPCHPDDIISISSKVKSRDGKYSTALVSKLITELSQPTRDFNLAGKMIINKTPDGTKSPNLADALMIRFCIGHRPMRIDPSVLLQMGIRV
jgi:phage terminase large subunit